MARGGERFNQRHRTRKDLLEAALRVTKGGVLPTLEAIAEAAMVSRATAYRYFPNVEALLVEASLHVAFPDVEATLGDIDSDDPVIRLERVDCAVAEMIVEHETALRLLVANAARQQVDGGDVLARQNRRLPLIDAALEPAAMHFEPAMLARLRAALSLVIGTEAMIVFKDVLRLDDDVATDVRRWAISALVDAARRGSRLP